MMAGRDDDPEADVVDIVSPQQLFDWGFCQRCMMVNEGWDPVASPPAPCPSCGFSDTGIDWPPPPARLLLRQVFHRQAVDQEEFALQAYLVTEMIDMVFAWVLRAAVNARAAENPRTISLSESARDFGLSINQRLDLLKKVGGVHLQQIALLLDEADFPERWNDLRERRDRFVGISDPQDTLAFDALTDKDLLEVSGMAVKVFAQVNNAVW